MEGKKRVEFGVQLLSGRVLPTMNTGCAECLVFKLSMYSSIFHPSSLCRSSSRYSSIYRPCLSASLKNLRNLRQFGAI